MDVKITNPVVYSVPSDSESDSEQPEVGNVQYKYPPRRRAYRDFDNYRYQKKLAAIGCQYNSLEAHREYIKEQLKLKVRTYDPNFTAQRKYLEHTLKVKKEIKASQRVETEKLREKFQALKTSLESELIPLPTAEDDKKFDEELKKDREAVEKAIAYERKKLETQTAQAKAKAEADAKAKAQKELEAKQLKEKNEKLMKQKQSAATSIEGLKEYEKYYAKIDNYKKNIRPMLQQDTFRKQCFEARKIIKRTVSQLQYKHEVIIEKYNVLNNHLMSVKQQSQEAFEVMLNFLAKTFLLQARQEIHATPFAAYFLGRFAYLLCATIPEFTDYLLGRLMKRCPYLIPRYHDDDSSLTQDEIKAKLRYDYSNKEKKTLQTFLQHAEQQKCFIMFYAALCQSAPERPGEPANPVPIKHAWIWLARICNMPPREITPMLVMGMLEIATKQLLIHYPNQTPKLLRLIQTQIIAMYPKHDTNDNVATVRRLEMFLDSYFKTGVPDCVPETLKASV